MAALPEPLTTTVLQQSRPPVKSPFWRPTPWTQPPSALASNAAAPSDTVPSLAGPSAGPPSEDALASVAPPSLGPPLLLPKQAAAANAPPKTTQTPSPWPRNALFLIDL